MNQKSTKLSIGILLPCLLTGGTEVASLETANALHSLGYSVKVVVYFDEIDATMLASFRANGLSVHLLGVKRGRSFLSKFHLTLALWKALKSARFDIIWFQYMTPTLQPLAITRIFTNKIIIAVHVAASHYSPTGLKRMRWVARHMSMCVVCVSNTVANGIFGPEGSEERKRTHVCVLPNALDLRAVKLANAFNWRSYAGWPQDVVILGFAGRLTYFKGVDLLLKAVAKLHTRGMFVRLTVVGDGEESIRLRTLAQELYIDSITCFAGRMTRAEIYGAIKGFDIAVMPSRSGLEGFGLSALEAMASGLPVVASRVDALQEVIVDGATGLLFQAEDEACLADTLAHLVTDTALRKKMGALGIERVDRLYNTPVYRDNIAKMMASLNLSERGHV